MPEKYKTEIFRKRKEGISEQLLQGRPAHPNFG